MLDNNIPRPHTVTRNRMEHGYWCLTAFRPDATERGDQFSYYYARKRADGKWRVYRREELVGVVATLADVRTALFDNEF
jgi:hypothetical protein